MHTNESTHLIDLTNLIHIYNFFWDLFLRILRFLNRFFQLLLFCLFKELVLHIGIYTYNCTQILVCHQKSHSFVNYYYNIIQSKVPCFCFVFTIYLETIQSSTILFILKILVYFILSKELRIYVLKIDQNREKKYSRVTCFISSHLANQITTESHGIVTTETQ